MKAKDYPLLVRCVEDGIKSGWYRAHKHVKKPDDDAIHDALEQAIMTEICEWFEFDDEKESFDGR